MNINLKVHPVKKTVAFLLLALHPFCSSAQIFSTDIFMTNPQTGESDSFQRDYSIAQDFFNDLSDRGFTRLFPNYSNNSIVSSNNIYNGLPINVSFPVSGSTKMVFEIPKLGILKTFSKSTRRQSTNALEHYLRNDIDGTASKIARYQIANTGTSPLAGNPTSLQGQLVSSDFGNAARLSLTANPRPNRFALGVGGGSYTQSGTDISVVNIPISQEIDIDSEHPGRKLLLNGQFNYVTIDQAESFQGSVGLGYAHPLNDNWSLIPNVSYGAIGTLDLYSLGQIIAASLTNSYRFNIDDYTLSTINMFGYYKTLPFNVSGVSSNPDINNYVLKNGFFVDKILPFTAFGHKLNFKGLFTDTQFFGSEVFIRQFNEVGFEINTVEKVEWLDTISFGIADTLSLSAKYVFSIENPNDFNGYEVGLGYNF